MPIDYTGGLTPYQAATRWGILGGGGGAGGTAPGGSAAPTGAPSGYMPFPGAVGYTAGYGGIPYVPSPTATAHGAITGNIGNLGGIYGLTTGTSGASAAGAATQYQQNLPGYGPMTTTASSNILSDLRGQVPADVINQLENVAAERGVGMGLGPDAPNTQAALLRALGLTSLDLQRQGQSELTAAIGRTPVGPAFNPASLLVSPGEQQGAATAAALYGAAPVPFNAAQAAIAAAGGGGSPRLGVPNMTIGGGGGFGPGTPSGQSLPVSGASTATDVTSSQPSPGAYSRWNEWYNSLFGQGGDTSTGTSETAGLGLEAWEEEFYNNYGFLPGGDTSAAGGGATLQDTSAAPTDYSAGYFE